MNFGIGYAFSNGPGTASSEDPGPGPGALYKVCRMYLSLCIFIDFSSDPSFSLPIATTFSALLFCNFMQHITYLRPTTNWIPLFIFMSWKLRIKCFQKYKCWRWSPQLYTDNCPCFIWNKFMENCWINVTRIINKITIN